MRPLELLSPARDAATAREAILHGADAVYIGAPSHGARAKAVNTIDDIRSLVEFAAPFGVKVYVTVNTIIYDNEIESVRRMVWELYAAGVDALIVQDMALLEMELPPIQLHASTQCDTRDAAKARWLQDIGMSQIVIARETGLDGIRRIAAAVTVPLEAFVHGALCVSYSGDCRASFMTTGRSANRGNCAQICRLPFDLIDGNGKSAGRKHYLSLRDMNRLEYIGEMADAGISSFKIEGRLKDASYVKEVTLAYRRAIDQLIAANPGKYCRASRGITTASFTPDLSKSFNRGYTGYFLTSPSSNAVKGNYFLASLDSPKALGEYVGKVIKSSDKSIWANLKTSLANGDGIAYVTPGGQTGGFRANKVEGNRIYPGESPSYQSTFNHQPSTLYSLPPGTKLYRSYDKEREQMLSRPTATRVIPIRLSLRRNGDNIISLSAFIEDIGEVTVTTEQTKMGAKNNPLEHRRRQLSKWGDTIFTVTECEDNLADEFIPASTLSEMRRRLADALISTLMARRIVARRSNASLRNMPVSGQSLTYRDNVSNRMAANFYRSCGVTNIEAAVETAQQPAKKKDMVLMESRYCLRRQLGACLKEGGNTKLPEPLTLKAQGFECRLEFDCKNCLMRVINK